MRMTLIHREVKNIHSFSKVLTNQGGILEFKTCRINSIWNNNYQLYNLRDTPQSTR